MFYLAGESEPRNTEQLSEAIREGIAQVISIPGGRQVVRSEGKFPHLSELSIDLSEGRIDPSRRPSPPPRGMGNTHPGVFAKVFKIIGEPVWIERAQLKLALSAAEIQFVLDRDVDGKLLLLPASCRDGQLSMEISRAQLEALILSQASIHAAEQGVKITGLELQLSRQGERTVIAEVRVAAKKMLFSGVVHLRGHLDVSDQLVATISGLEVRGEGMAGTMAAGFLKGKLRQIDGRQIPLADFALSGIHLRDVRIESVDPLRVTASFGS